MRSPIRRGVHRPGESLPSLRSLALEIRVNPNTLQRAYDLLESEPTSMIRERVKMVRTVPEDRIESALTGKLDALGEQQFATRLAGIRSHVELIGKPIELAGQTLAGETIDLADYRGKIVLVEFWGTGCLPCVADMPEMVEIYQRYREGGFEIIGIPTDPYPGKLMSFLESRNVTWPQIWGREANLETMETFGVSSIPSSILLDREGCVIALVFAFKAQIRRVSWRKRFEVSFRRDAASATGCFHGVV